MHVVTKKIADNTCFCGSEHCGVVILFEHDETMDLYDELRHLQGKQVTKLLGIMQLHLGANISVPNENNEE